MKKFSKPSLSRLFSISWTGWLMQPELQLRACGRWLGRRRINKYLSESIPAPLLPEIILREPGQASFFKSSDNVKENLNVTAK
jgi:hypothetical protein